MSDFHRRAVVYYRCGKSLFNTFCLCELQKMGRRTMLDRGKGGGLASEGDQRRRSFKGFGKSYMKQLQRAVEK